MTTEKRIGYKIEIEEVEREAPGEVRIRARAFELLDTPGERQLVQLRPSGHRLKWHAHGRIKLLDAEGEVARFQIERGVGSDSYVWAELLLTGQENPSAKSEQLSPRELRALEDSHAPPPRRHHPQVEPAARVQLTRTQAGSTRDLILSTAIRYSTESIKFPNYARFLDYVLCGDEDAVQVGDRLETDERGIFSVRKRVKEGYDELSERLQQRKARNGGHKLTGIQGYRALRDATEWFLKVHVGVLPSNRDFDRIEADLIARVGAGLPPTNEPGSRVEAAWNAYAVNVDQVHMLPYLKIIRNKLADVPIGTEEDSAIIECSNLLRDKLQFPCFTELIWSYWQEEGMLVQTVNAIVQRFQNRRVSNNRDPLANLEIDPLRPLNNLLWGYVQDELSRLSVVRRAHEYEHHYGLRLEGRALARFRPVERRSKFIEAFHHFLLQCHTFYERDDQTTVFADGFPVLNAIKEVHYLLAQGAHNQFGDLPSTSRAEMLVQQWLLSRPEMREFLGGRVMVPYPEAWMDRVDAMKALQGWSDTGVVHFNDLATFGEQVVLGLRYGGWSLVHDPAAAANFARIWRAEIQGYVHAYRAVTGVALGAPVTTQQAASERNLPPSVHLMRRLASAKRA